MAELPPIVQHVIIKVDKAVDSQRRLKKETADLDKQLDVTGKRADDSSERIGGLDRSITKLATSTRPATQQMSVFGKALQLFRTVDSRGLDNAGRSATATAARARDASRDVATLGARFRGLNSDTASATGSLAGVNRLFEGVEKGARKAGRSVETHARAHETSRRSVIGHSNSLQGLIRSMSSTNIVTNFFRRTLSLIKFPAIILGVNLLAGALSALAGGAYAAIAALGPLTGLLGALPGLGIAAATGIGAIFASFSGIGDVVKAYSQQQKAAATSSSKAGGAASSAARAQQSAANRVKDATQSLSDAQANGAEQVAQAERALADARENGADAIQSAERQLADAEDRAAEAQTRLNDARDEAVTRLRELREEQERNRISVERADIALEEARRRLIEVTQDPGRDPLDRRRAILDVRDAELDLVDARERKKDQEKELSEAAKKGVEGDDQVVAARKAVADANQNLVDSQVTLVRAHRDAARAIEDALKNVAQAGVSSSRAVADAQEGLTDALSGSAEGAGATATAAANLQYALDQLTPAGRALALTLISMKDVWDEFKKSVAESTLPGFTDALVMVKGIVPQITPLVAAMGGVIGDTVRQFANLITGPDILARIQRVMLDNVGVAENFGKGFLGISDAFFVIADAARPLVRWIGELAASFGDYISKTVRVNEANGDLARFFGQVRVVTRTVGRSIRDFGVGLYNIGKIANQSLGGFILGGLRKTAKEFRNWTESAKGRNSIRDYFDSLKEPLRAMGRLLKAVTLGFGEIATSTNLAPLIDQVREELLPPLLDVLRTVSEGGLGERLIDLAASVTKFFGAIAGESGPLLKAVGFLTDLIDVFTTIVDKTPGAQQAIFTISSAAGLLGALSFTKFLTGWGKVSKALNLGPGLIGGVSDAFKGLEPDLRKHNGPLTRIGRGLGRAIRTGILDPLKNVGQKILDFINPSGADRRRAKRAAGEAGREAVNQGRRLPGTGPAAGGASGLGGLLGTNGCVPVEPCGTSWNRLFGMSRDVDLPGRPGPGQGTLPGLGAGAAAGAAGEAIEDLGDNRPRRGGRLGKAGGIAGGIGMIGLDTVGLGAVGDLGGLLGGAGIAGTLGLVAAAAAAIGTAVFLAYKHIKPFRQAVDSTWQGIQKGWDKVLPILKSVGEDLGDIFAPIFDVLKPLGKIVLFFVEAVNPITLFTLAFHGIKKAIEVLTPVIRFLGDVFSKVWDIISAAASWAWDNVLQPIFSAVVSVITTVVIPAFKLWAAVWMEIWEVVKGVIKVAWEVVIKPIWEEIRDFIDNPLMPSIRLIGSVFGEVFDAVKAVVRGAWDFIQPIFEGAIDFIKNTLFPVIKRIYTVFSDVFNGIKGFLSEVWDDIIGVIGRAIERVKGVMGTVLRGIASVLDFVGLDHIADAIRSFVDAPSGGGAGVGSRRAEPRRAGFAAGGEIPAAAMGQRFVPASSHRNTKRAEVGAGFITGTPRAIVGEGSRYPEFVIPTDPAYRKRALSLTGQLVDRLTGGHGGARGGRGLAARADGGLLPAHAQGTAQALLNTRFADAAAHTLRRFGLGIARILPDGTFDERARTGADTYKSLFSQIRFVLGDRSFPKNNFATDLAETIKAVDPFSTVSRAGTARSTEANYSLITNAVRTLSRLYLGISDTFTNGGFRARPATADDTPEKLFGVALGNVGSGTWRYRNFRNGLERAVRQRDPGARLNQDNTLASLSPRFANIKGVGEPVSPLDALLLKLGAKPRDIPAYREFLAENLKSRQASAALPGTSLSFGRGGMIPAHGIGDVIGGVLNPANGLELAGSILNYGEKALGGIVNLGSRLAAATIERVWREGIADSVDPTGMFSGLLDKGRNSLLDVLRGVAGVEDQQRAKNASATRAGGGHARPATEVARGPLVDLARQLSSGRGWTGGEFNALVDLVNRESGWRPAAQNPTSTAYGLFQFLDSTWKGTGFSKTSDPRTQILAGLQYISSRYGTPSRALDFWLSHHWYGKGGEFPARDQIQGAMAEGGVSVREGLYRLSEGNRREATLPLDNPRAMALLRDRLGGGGVGPVSFEFNFNGPIYGVEDLDKHVESQVDEWAGRLATALRGN